MARCTKALVERVGELTNRIFIDAIKEVLGFDDNTPDEDVYSAIDMVRHARVYAHEDLFPEEEVRQMLESKDKVDALYLKKMLGLSSKQLDEIIIAHNANKIRRMSKTIEAILSELARRSIFGDVTESDDRYNNGEVHGHKVKSKDNNKSVKTKRNKAVKGR